MMNSCRCISCYPSQQHFYYREIQYCPCESMHYTRHPQAINPLRARPVILKTPVEPLPLPQSILMRNSERNMTQTLPRSGQTKLKFGIDSILGREDNESVRPVMQENLDIMPSCSSYESSNCIAEKKDFKVFETSSSQSSTSRIQPGLLESKYTKHTKAMPPKRAVFSDFQRRQLEVEFLAHKYISKQERRILAKRLELSESQVRIWFQNRRMKWRNRQEREMMRRQRINSMKT